MNTEKDYGLSKKQILINLYADVSTALNNAELNLERTDKPLVKYDINKARESLDEVLENGDLESLAISGPLIIYLYALLDSYPETLVKNKNQIINYFENRIAALNKFQL